MYIALINKLGWDEQRKIWLISFPFRKLDNFYDLINLKYFNSWVIEPFLKDTTYYKFYAKDKINLIITLSLMIYIEI